MPAGKCAGAAKAVAEIEMVMLGVSVSEHKEPLSAHSSAHLWVFPHKHQTCEKSKKIKWKYKVFLSWNSKQSPPEYLICMMEDL